MVTSNHIHLLIVDTKQGSIAPGLQLIEGRVGQEYNNRKKRDGAFWSDSYHAKIIDTDNYLRECMLYIDLNMVRTGVVSHPEKWIYCGYFDIHCRQRSNLIIDENLLRSYLGFTPVESFKNEYPQWINQTLQKGKQRREKHWSESIAVGTASFLETIQAELGLRGKNRTIDEIEELNILHEPMAYYNGIDITVENPYLIGKNTVNINLTD